MVKIRTVKYEISPIPVAMWSKVCVCNFLIADIASSNPAESMEYWSLASVVCCVGSSLWDGADHSYRGVLPDVCLIVCDLEPCKVAA